MFDSSYYKKYLNDLLILREKFRSHSCKLVLAAHGHRNFDFMPYCEGVCADSFVDLSYIDDEINRVSAAWFDVKCNEEIEKNGAVHLEFRSRDCDHAWSEWERSFASANDAKEYIEEGYKYAEGPFNYWVVSL